MRRTGLVVLAMAAALIVGSCTTSDPPSRPRSDPPDRSDGDPRSAAPSSSSAERVIVDTDLSRFWDDASAIGIANVLHAQGEVDVLGMVSDVPNDIAVAALDAINTAYGHPDIPLGALAGSDADTEDHGYTEELVATLPHSVQSAADVPDAVALYRQLLADQPDHSVTVISLGSYTNLAGLIASRPDDISRLDGRALVARKVDRLVVMDGLFPDGLPPVTNQQYDLPAAAAVVGEGTTDTGWPTPITWVDGTTSVTTDIGTELCTDAPPHHPIRIVYENLFGCGPPTDGNWDAPTFLFAVGDTPTAFTQLGQGGSAVINPDGGLSWQERSSRPSDTYVHLTNTLTLTPRINALLVAEPHQ
jgi:inosine-uridine preferring nucleoside hydrolase